MKDGDTITVGSTTIKLHVLGGHTPATLGVDFTVYDAGRPYRAFMFGVNPYAVQIDGILDGGNVNLDWDGVWDAETSRDSTGWTAEIAVPLRTLRFPGKGPGVWGLWMRRQITRDSEV